MSENGERPAGQRRSGPNPEPYPWPGPGPGSDVLEDAGSFRRSHIRLDRYNKKINPCRHHPVFERSSQLRDRNGRASSSPRQNRPQDNSHLHCHPNDKLSTSLSTPEPLRNKPSGFSRARTSNDRNIHKTGHGVGPSPLSSSVMSIEKLRASSGTRGHPTDGRNHHNHVISFKGHFKHHAVKSRDPLAFPVSVHPIQPFDLHCKTPVNKDSVASYRSILDGEVDALALDKRLCTKNTARRQVCAQTSNPDIKTANVDEACGTEPTPKGSGSAEFVGSGLALANSRQSFSISTPHFDGCPVQITRDGTAEYSLIRRHDTFIKGVERASCPHVQFTAPDGQELKIEKYVPPEDDWMKCSIHACRMSSAMMSGLTLGQEMSASQNLALVLPGSAETRDAQSTGAVVPLLERDPIGAYSLRYDWIQTPVLDDKIQSLSSVSFSPVSRESSYDEYGSDYENSQNGYLRDSCNDSDYINRYESRIFARNRIESSLNKSEITLNRTPELDKTQDADGKVVVFEKTPLTTKKTGTNDDCLDADEQIKTFNLHNKNVGADKGPLETDETMAVDQRTSNVSDKLYEKTYEKTTGMIERAPEMNETTKDERHPYTDDRTPRQDQAGLPLLEHKSSSTPTVNYAKVDANQNVRKNMVVLVSRSLDPDKSEEIHFEVQSKDLITRGIQRPGLVPEELATESMGENGQFIAVDSFQVKRLGETVADKLSVTAGKRNGSCKTTLPQTVNTTVLFPLPHQTLHRQHGRDDNGRAAEILPTTEARVPPDVPKGSQTRSTLENFTVDRSVKRLLQKSNGEHSQAKIIQRRNTFPQISRDNWRALVGWKKDKKILSDCAILENGVSVEEIQKRTDDIEDFTDTLYASTAQKHLWRDKIEESELLVKTKGFLRRKRTSQMISDVECQVSWTNTEETESDSGVSRTLKDEYSTNRLDLVCNHEITKISLDTLQSERFQERSCQASLQTLTDQTECSATTGCQNKTDEFGVRLDSVTISEVVLKQACEYASCILSVNEAGILEKLSDLKSTSSLESIRQNNQTYIENENCSTFGCTDQALNSRSLTNEDTCEKSTVEVETAQNKSNLNAGSCKAFNRENVACVQDTTTTVKRSCDCQVISFPMSSTDNGNSGSSSQSNIQRDCSCVEKHVEFKFKTECFLQENERVGENSYDFNWAQLKYETEREETDKISPTEIWIKNCSQGGHVCQVYGTYTDQESVDFEVVSYQNENQNNHIDLCQENADKKCFNDVPSVKNEKNDLEKKSNNDVPPLKSEKYDVEKFYNSAPSPRNSKNGVGESLRDVQSRDKNAVDKCFNDAESLNNEKHYADTEKADMENKRFDLTGVDLGENANVGLEKKNWLDCPNSSPNGSRNIQHVSISCSNQNKSDTKSQPAIEESVHDYCGCEPNYFQNTSFNESRYRIHPLDKTNGETLGKIPSEKNVKPESARKVVVKSLSATESRATRNVSQTTAFENKSGNREPLINQGRYAVAVESEKRAFRNKIEHHPESHLVKQKTISSNSRKGCETGSLEETESSKETRGSSICDASHTDSEEPVCVAEQLEQRNAGAEGSEESMTAKSVAELTEEDALPQSERRNYKEITLDNNEKMRLDDNEKMSLEEEMFPDDNMSIDSTNRISAPVTATLFSLDGTTDEGKTAVSRYSVRRSSSGVRIITLDDSCKVSGFAKVSELIEGVGNRMGMLKNQVVLHLAPKFSSQLIPKTDQLSPRIGLPDDVTSNSSSFSLKTTREGAEKETLKSGRTSRGSGRVEWTISVKDENGVETQRSVDIITINDPTEQLERRSNDDTRVIVESPCGTVASVSSYDTRVLMRPPSGHSIETSKDSSKIIDGDYSKTQDVCKKDNPARTKLARCADRNPETRNRFYMTSGKGFRKDENEEMIYRKESSVRSMKNIFSEDYHEKNWHEIQRYGGHEIKDIQNTISKKKGFCNIGNVAQKDVLAAGIQGVSIGKEEFNFEQYRSISDICLTEFNRMASDFDYSDFSPEQSASPSLLNLGRFTPPTSSSWSSLCHRQAIDPSSNVLAVPSIFSRTKYTSRYLHSDEDINSSRNRKPGSREWKRRPRRSDFFPESSEDIRAQRPYRNMNTKDPDIEQRAACLFPENHGARVVTFENIPSPRSTIRRLTLTPRGESCQAIDLSDTDVSRAAKSSNPGFSEDRFLQVSRMSSDASGCCVEDLFSAAQMSRQKRLGASVTRIHNYEEVPSCHENVQERPSAERAQTICLKMPQHLSPRASSAVQTYPVTNRSHPDLRMLTSSKTTLLSLMEAGVHSSSRLSSPTPSDIPSPPPSPSPNRLTIYPSQSKVDVAVGIGKLDSDPLLAEPVLSASCNIDDSPTTIEIPVSPTGFRYSSFGSSNVSAFRVVSNSTFQENIPNATQSSETRKAEPGSIFPIFAPANVHPTVSRGVGVTTKSAHVLASSTPRTRPVTEKNLYESVTSTQVIRRHSRGTTCYAASRFQAPIFLANSKTEITSNSNACLRKPEKKDEKNCRKSASHQSIDTASSSSKDMSSRVTKSHKFQRPTVVSGHYRFGSANVHCCQYSDLMGEMAEVNTAIPSRMTSCRSSVSTNRLSPNIVVGSHSRFVGTRILVPSSSDEIDVEYTPGISEPHRCHRERSSYAHKVQPMPILRPADASCISRPPTETSNAVERTPAMTNQITLADTNQRTPEDNQHVPTDVNQCTLGVTTQKTLDDKRTIKESQVPLPPAALDQSEESWDSRQGAGSFSNGEVTTNLPLKIGSGGAVLAANLGPEPSVRFSGSGSKPRPGSGCIGTRGQSFCLSTPGTGSISYPGAPSFSIPSISRSIPDSYRESTCEYVPSLSRHEGSTPSAQPHLEHLPIDQPTFQRSANALASCGVICPEVNLRSQPRHKICVSIKSSNSGPFSKTVISPFGPESNVTRIVAPQTQDDPIQPEVQGPDTGSYRAYAEGIDADRVSDAVSEMQRSRGTLTDEIKERLARSHGRKQSRSLAHSVAEKGKPTSHKTAHKTGSKSKKGSVPNHVIRCTPSSSKTAQAKTTKSIVVTESSSAVEITSHPSLAGVYDQGHSEDHVSSAWVFNRDGEAQGKGDEESYIEEESENTESTPSGRLQSKCITGSQAVNNITIVESVATEACEFPPQPYDTADMMPRPDVMHIPDGMAAGGPKWGAIGSDFPATGQDVPLSIVHDESEAARAETVRTETTRAETTRAETTRAETEKQQTQHLKATACVSNAIYKNVRHPPPGKRNNLYTTRVGYIGPPRPLHPIPATACRHVKRPLEQTPSVPKFQSKFHYYVRHQFYKNKKPHQTLGVAELPPELPNDFVKRQSKPRGPDCAIADRDIQFPFILARPDGEPKRKCKTIYDEARGKAPFKEEKCERDYIQANIQNACQAVPLRRPVRFVDSVYGHTQLMEPSGLEPRYVFRKDAAEVPNYLSGVDCSEEGIFIVQGYGEAPAYLSQVGLGNRAATGFVGGLVGSEGRGKAAARGRSGSIVGGDSLVIRRSAANERQRHPLRYITEPERAQLIEGLKQNWQELTSVFQGLPMMTDTIAKMKRKETLENELRQLEKDIATIEQNPIIYINQGAGDACNAAHIWVD